MLLPEDLKHEKFIKAYLIVLSRTDLLPSHKLLLIRALQFESGWFETTTSISRTLGLSRRTVQRGIDKLKKNGDLALLPDHDLRSARTLYPTLKGLPLFEFAKSIAKQKRANYQGAK